MQPSADINLFNRLDIDAARAALTRCCGSSGWVEGMLAKRPFGSEQKLLSAADEVWFALSESDWLEAFEHHPKIGEIGDLRKKFAATADLSQNEQRGVAGVSEEILQRLAAGNAAYEKKFGFIFIVCATGKAASEMLRLLEDRLPNDRATELMNAAREQSKIMKIRLGKLGHETK